MIRLAEAADAAAIAVLEAALFGADAWTVAQVAEELTGYGRQGWVAEALTDHSVSGYVIMRTVADVSDLQRIGVDPAQQRRGLAGRLLAAARAGVRTQGAERVLLEVAEDNAAARAFYARAGFVEIDRRRNYYRQTVDALVLAHELGPAE